MGPVRGEVLVGIKQWYQLNTLPVIPANSNNLPSKPNKLFQIRHLKKDRIKRCCINYLDVRSTTKSCAFTN